VRASGPLRDLPEAFLRGAWHPFGAAPLWGAPLARVLLIRGESYRLREKRSAGSAAALEPQPKERR